MSREHLERCVSLKQSGPKHQREFLERSRILMVDSYLRSGQFSDNFHLKMPEEVGILYIAIEESIPFKHWALVIEY
jgi:hypothetical protein